MSVSSSTRLNDVNLEAVAGLAAAIQERPEIAATTWSAEVHWTGGFRSEAVVREFEPRTSDEPAALGGTDVLAQLRDFEFQRIGSRDILLCHRLADLFLDARDIDDVPVAQRPLPIRDEVERFVELHLRLLLDLANRFEERFARSGKIVELRRKIKPTRSWTEATLPKL